MKRILFIATMLLLSSCHETELPNEERVYDYKDVQDRFIEWKDVLAQEKENYFVYVFSYSCGHCKDIKQDILKKTIIDGWDIYYVEYTSDILIVDSNMPYIGITDYQKLGIIGTPTLFEISSGAVKDRFTGSKEIIDTLYSN